MSQLKIEDNLIGIGYDGTEKESHWCVTEAVTTEGYIVIGGFARQRDAEIAKQYLEEFSDIDYTLSRELFWRQFGVESVDDFMKLVCQRLQW